MGIPDNLLRDRWFPLPGKTIDFDGFLQWFQAYSFEEVFLVPSISRSIRDLARKHDIELNLVERIHRVFQRVDEDGSGAIEFEEFRSLIASLFGAAEGDLSEAMLRSLWADASGPMDSIDFEAFMLWYTRHFESAAADSQGVSLLREYYRSQRPVNVCED